MDSGNILIIATIRRLDRPRYALLHDPRQQKGLDCIRTVTKICDLLMSNPCSGFAFGVSARSPRIGKMLIRFEGWGRRHGLGNSRTSTKYDIPAWPAAGADNGGETHVYEKH